MVESGAEGCEPAAVAPPMARMRPSGAVALASQATVEVADSDLEGAGQITINLTSTT